MVIKRMNPMSVAKMSGILGVLLGLVIGAFVSLGMMLWGRSSAAVDSALPAALFPMLFGAGAIIILPIFYGVFLFIVGLIQATLYNVAAKWVGGVEVDVA